MKILVVGDIHGDWGKLNSLINDKRPEIVIQCGDFGWWPKMEVKRPVRYHDQKKWLLEGIKPCGSDIYFCDGNHEDHDALVQTGGITELYEHVHHATRGSVQHLSDGRTILYAGGAASIDKNMRIAGHDWFQGETINNSDLDIMLSHQKVDIVISHTCPTSFFPHLKKGNIAKVSDPSCKALEYVLDKYKPEQWFFGHWHMNKEGYDKGCHWQCLDYPRHGGMWWKWLK